MSRNRRTFPHPQLSVLICVLLATGLAAMMAHAHMGADGVVKERMESMKAVAQANKAIRKMLKDTGTADPDKIAAAADIIADHTAKFVDLFPAGSGGGVSEAAPTIWEDPTEFKARADAALAAALRLKAAAKSNDYSVLQQASRTLGKTCGACHKLFRVERNTR